jgi:hypothetical protein
MPVQRGDRFRLRRDSPQDVTIVGYAPSHTMTVASVVPQGTIIVALDQVAGARGFTCYPQEYDQLELQLVPEEIRSQDYVAYALGFPESDIGDLLDPIEPLSPRPPSRLPREQPR